MAYIRVYGEPAAQGSKRHIGGGRMIEQSRKVAPWRAAVRAASAHLTPIAAPCRVEVTFYVKRPKKPRWKLPGTRGTGDIDKLLRSTLDGLTEVGGRGAFLDDSLVVSVGARKYYENESTRQGAVIYVDEINASHEPGMWAAVKNTKTSTRGRDKNGIVEAPKKTHKNNRRKAQNVQHANSMHDGRHEFHHAPSVGQKGRMFKA